MRWGTFGVYGVKLHLLCAPNRVPISYEELTPANVADVSLTEELLAEAKLGEEVARRGYSEISPTAAKNRGKPSWPRWASSWRASHPSGDGG